MFPEEQEEGVTQAPPYYDYTITLRPMEPNQDVKTITDYGWFLDNGVNSMIMRGRFQRGEIMTCVPSENVWFVQAHGEHRQSTSFDA